MPDADFLKWQQLQQELLDAQRRLVLASDPASSPYAGASLEALQQLVEALRVEADNALQACLAETQRSRRVGRSVGLNSTLGAHDAPEE